MFNTFEGYLERQVREVASILEECNFPKPEKIQMMFKLASLVIDQLLIYDMCFCADDIKSFIANGKLPKIALDYFIKKTEHNEQTYMTQFIKNKTKNDRMSELEPFLSKLSFPDQMEKWTINFK